MTIALLSQTRQRRAFYYAGVLNTGGALYLIADHRRWFDQPLWAIAVIVSGLIVLVAGFVLDRRARRRRAGPKQPAKVQGGPSASVLRVHGANVHSA